MERKIYSDNEKMILYAEVDGHCPKCGETLHKVKGKVIRAFEIAHIFPLNPTPDEVLLLKDEEKLSDNSNDMRNVIALCPNCHDAYDTNKTVEEYRELVKIKKRLLERSDIRNAYKSFDVENEIKLVLNKLSSISSDGALPELSLNALCVDQKADNTLPYILKKQIIDDVTSYFLFLKSNFIELDKSSFNMFNTIAAQVKAFYNKCLQTSRNQQDIYRALVDWLNNKTGYTSERACEIIIAFFVQNCEVFS